MSIWIQIFFIRNFDTAISLSNETTVIISRDTSVATAFYWELLLSVKWNSIDLDLGGFF